MKFTTRTSRSACRRWATMAVIALLGLAACGSKYTEQEILARAVTGSRLGGQVDASTPTTASNGPVGASTATAPTGAALSAGPTGAGAIHTGSTQGSTSAGCSTTKTGPILIGSVGNYSGPGGSAIGNMPRAVQIWAAEINSKGGLCGRPVQVLVADDGGDPVRYGAIVRDMVENRHVVAFVGNGAILSAQGGLAYHNQSRVPVIGNDCGRDDYYTSPVIAPECPIFSEGVRNVVRTGIQLTGKKRFGYLYCTEAQGCLSLDQQARGGAVAAGGGQLVFSKSISITQVDFTAECQSARDAGVELFSVFADPPTVSRVARSCVRQGYRPQYVEASVSVTVNQSSEPGLENVAVFNPVFPFIGGSGPGIDAYQHAIDTFAPGQVQDGALAEGWASARLFEVIATRAARSSGSITPDSLDAGILTVSGETLDGLTTALTFTPQGARPASCYFVMRGNGQGSYTTPLGSRAQC